MKADGPARQASSIQRGSVAFISTYAGGMLLPLASDMEYEY